MEGVDRNKVRLLAHNSEWGKEFLQVSAQINKCWGDNVLDVRHVGSTAVKSICAKPILDVAVRLQSIEKVDIKALTDLGYEYRGAQNVGMTWVLFVLREGNLSLRHIHCFDKAEREFDLHTAFCDYLNAHPEVALQYQEIKRRLAAQYPDDRVAYTNGKTQFIKSILERISAV